VATVRQSVGAVTVGALTAAAGLVLESQLVAIEGIHGNFVQGIDLLNFASVLGIALTFIGVGAVLVGGVMLALRRAYRRSVQLFLPLAIVSVALLPVLNFNKEDWTAMLLFVLQAGVVIPCIMLAVGLIVHFRPGRA
jgi:hypothetical protein